MATHLGAGGRGTGERLRRSTVTMPPMASPPPKKKVSMSAAWNEARGLIWTHRKRLTLGLALMLISRLAGLVLPASSKYLIDEVVTGKRTDLLLPIALAAGAATVVQAVTSFALSQILGVAAQRAITDMRKRVQARVMHLPVRYFDSTQTGILVSRIMSDAEGIRKAQPDLSTPDLRLEDQAERLVASAGLGRREGKSLHRLCGRVSDRVGAFHRGGPRRHPFLALRGLAF